MRYTNLKGLPEAIVQAIANDPYDDQGSDITASRLPDSPRVVALSKKHRDELVEDASDAIWLLLGKAVHYILEKSEPSELTELRLFTAVRDWKVSGAFDHFQLSKGKLTDYKVTSVWAVIYQDRLEEWTGQLNILAELVDRNSDQNEIRELSILAILRDWSEGKAKEGGNYPGQQIVEIPVPLWSREERGRYLESRVLLHQAAQEDVLPQCSPRERWASPDTWAVKKGENKKASRVFPTESEAVAYIGDTGGLWIDHRPGASRRCEEYCAVAPFCEQWKAIQNA